MNDPNAAATLRLIRAAECRRMPWKNGGGFTTEVAVFPPESGLDDFLWRVSMAQIAGDGPFSAFAGIDRTLTLLEGDGLELHIGDAAAHTLVPGSPPLSFAADVPTYARLLGGAVTDLNVMTRRGVLRHVVTALKVPPTTTLDRTTSAPTVLWLCHRGRMRVELTTASGGFDLKRGDTLLAQAIAERSWRIAGHTVSEAFLVEIWPAERPAAATA